jgi:SAM-dependent methyltransferase
MNCCTLQGTNRFFSESAGYHAWKFRFHGLDRPQRMIRRLLVSRGLQGRSVLEIGCGVGGLHLTLLRDGAAQATGIDVSDGMIVKAKELARELGVEGRTAYTVGDFVVRSTEMPVADIVVMDKVLCCYSEPAPLLRQAASKSGALIVLTYPRDSLLVRGVFRCYGLLGNLLRWEFRPLFHEPSELDGLTRSEGFREAFAARTVLWQLKLFEKE